MPFSGKLQTGTSAADGVWRLCAHGGPWRTPFRAGSSHIRLNKAAGLGFLFFCCSIALLLLLAGRGGEEKELGGAIAGGFGGGRGRMKLQVGEEHMVAGSRRHDQWSSRWPLQVPLMASAQPPSRRPLHGASSAFIAPSAPSGVVPGGKGSGRRWSSDRGGRVQGSDRFSILKSRVLCAKVQAYVVIFNLLGS